MAGASRLFLTDFRNYVSADVSLAEGLNVVFGPNAQGKTNLLESLYLLGTTRLLRGIRDYEAIRHGAEKAEIRAEVIRTRTEVSMSLQRGIRKKAALNGMNLRKASDVIGRLPCVCASLADLPIVSGDPSERRMFLDLELSQLSGAYLHHFSLYRRALDQRNALLKAAQETSIPDEAFGAWEEQLASHGAPIRAERKRFLDRLAPLAAEVHAEMGGGEHLGLVYEPKDEAETFEALAEGLASNRFADVRRGTTQIGPHRDDFRISVAQTDARVFASQGQQRTAVLALKLATLEYEREERGIPPMLLLDDILSDLDDRRRHALADWVMARAGQAILTCTDLDLVSPAVRERAQLLRVDSGTVAIV